MSRDPIVYPGNADSGIAMPSPHKPDSKFFRVFPPGLTMEIYGL